MGSRWYRQGIMFSTCPSVCVYVCVCVCVRACVRACMRACACLSVFPGGDIHSLACCRLPVCRCGSHILHSGCLHLCLQCFDAVVWATGTERWGAGVVVCLERGADLHMPQWMPLPRTVSFFSKVQIGFTFLVPAHPGSPGQRAVKRVCVCVCCLHLDSATGAV